MRRSAVVYIQPDSSTRSNFATKKIRIMSRATFKILFYLKRNAPKKNGLIPVMCRITVNGKIAQFSCKLDVEEKMWSVETGRLTGRSNIALEGNRMLDKIRVGVNKAYQDVFDRDTYVTAEKVRNEYLGMGMNHKTLLAVFRQHNEDYAKLVGKMKSQRSYWKYCVVYKHLSEFIKTRYKVEDIALKELAPAFITDFELFLRVEKGHCTNTVWSYMMPFRSGGERALHQHRMVVHDAFPEHHLHRHQQRLVAARPVLCLPHHEGGNETRLPDERGNHADDKLHVQEEL